MKKPASMTMLIHYLEIGVIGFFCLFALPACESDSAPPVVDTLPVPSNTPISTVAIEGETPTPTSVLASSGHNQIIDEEPIVTNFPTEPAIPLEFAFPTIGPAPVSSWRPPLYPVPWEPTPHDHFYFIRPIGANDVNWPLARYRYGYLLYTEPHTGIDIPAHKGTPILAAGPGTITHAGYGLYFSQNQSEDPYGIAVAIKHDFGYKGQVLYTIYGHMDQTYVYQGQHVEAGEVIGLVGETGNVSGPHLHFEVRLGNHTFFSSRNPELWISPPQGWGVLVGRITESNVHKLPQVKVRLVKQDTKRVYEVISYAVGSVNSDEYYNENLVLGDLPAGLYTLYVEYNFRSYKTEIRISGGEVTFVRFGLSSGFDTSLPPEKGPKFIPPELVVTPTFIQFSTAP
jgi:murein DD-endopeptidase MepM/ murein hydrolase activator NlpD